MKTSPLSFVDSNLVGKSYNEIKKLRGLGLIGPGISTSASRTAAMEERLQANNPEAPQNQPITQVPNIGGVSNQSGDVGYNTGANYLEQYQLASTLNPTRSSNNPNVRTSTKKIGEGGYAIGEYQQIRGGMAGRASRMNSVQGLYGDEDSRQASVGLGEIPAAFRGGPNENIDDRQNQFNNLLFNPNVKSDQGLNEQYESFYNTQGIV